MLWGNWDHLLSDYRSLNKNDKETTESKDKKEAKKQVSKAQQEMAATKQEEKQDPVSQPVAKEKTGS